MLSRRPIGEILVQRGTISRADIQRALKAQQRLRLPLVSTLLRMGLADEPTLVGALGEQFEIPAVDLGASVVETAILTTIPKSLALAHLVVPVARDSGVLHVAIADPTRSDLLDELSFVAGVRAVPLVAIRLRIEETIEALYEAKEAGTPLYRGERGRASVPALATVAPEAPNRTHAALRRATTTPPLEEPSSAPPPVRVLGENTKARVVVADSDSSALDLVEQALSRRNIEVFPCRNAAEALKLIDGQAPNLVLLDGMLPDIQGFEVCEQLKKSATHAELPVVIVSAMATGWSFAQDVRRVYGADAYVSKPFRVPDLVHTVEALVDHSTPSPDAEAAEAPRHAQLKAGQAAEAYQAGQVEEAGRLAIEALEADPFDTRARFLLGTIENARGHVHQAVAHYERVVDLEPSMFQALKNLAVIYERQGFRSRAVEMWMRTLDHSPTDAVRQTIKAHLFALL